MKRTEWFHGSIKPHHVGWYEVKGYGFFKNGTHEATRGIVMRYWNGSNWQWEQPDGQMGLAAFSPDMGDKWRGLTKLSHAALRHAEVVRS